MFASDRIIEPLSKPGTERWVQLTFRLCHFSHRCPFSVPGSYFAFNSQIFISSLWPFLSQSMSFSTVILEVPRSMGLQPGFVWCFLTTRPRFCVIGKESAEVMWWTHLSPGDKNLRRWWWHLKGFSTVPCHFSFTHHFWVYLEPLPPDGWHLGLDESLI